LSNCSIYEAEIVVIELDIKSILRIVTKSQTFFNKYTMTFANIKTF
jgi:hypothetical protein